MDGTMGSPVPRMERFFWIESFLRPRYGEPGSSSTVPAGSSYETQLLLCLRETTFQPAAVEHILANHPGIRLLSAMQGSWELAREHVPDLILLDLHLPVSCPARRSLKRLQNGTRRLPSPLIIITAIRWASRRLLAWEPITKLDVRRVAGSSSGLKGWRPDRI